MQILIVLIVILVVVAIKGQAETWDINEDWDGDPKTKAWDKKKRKSYKGR